MSAGVPPVLSVVLVTPDTFEAIRKSIEHVRRQSVRNEIEIVIVAPSEERLGLDPLALEGFWGWQVVSVGDIRKLAPVEAEGVRRARGSLVVYVEEHSFPQAGWAEALIAAHKGPWAAVGPAIVNANPDTRVSWASFLVDFGRWAIPADPGPADTLPSHQTSYKLAVLQSYGSHLGDLLEAESVLQEDLRKKGHQLYFEPRARTAHVNVSRIFSVMSIEFNNFRAFAARRVAEGQWSWARRVLYVAGSPLIPLLHLRLVIGHIRRIDLPGGVIPLLPMLGVILSSAAAGELAGYLLGKGSAPKKQLPFELKRLHYVTSQDRQKLLATSDARGGRLGERW